MSRDGNKQKWNVVTNFDFLRGLIHLSESGMKHITGQEAVRDFLNALTEPEDGFWKGWPEKWKNIPPEEMRPFVQVDNYLHIFKCEEAWKQAFPDLAEFDARENHKKHLVERFYEKYGSMTAQELLESLYADEAAWQAAHCAEAKAAQAAAQAQQLMEEERVAHGERLYRNGLLYSGLGEEEAGLAAMQEAAELGNQRAVLWLLKKAAYNGSADAYCMLGDLSLEGAYGMPQDELAAYGYYLAACRGSGRANAILSDFYRKGMAGLKEDEAMAEGFFAASVELGYGPSCFKQADRSMSSEDWEEAETVLNRLVSKTGEGQQEEVFAALAALADLFQRKGENKKALEYAIRFADLDYAQDPEDKGWKQYRDGVLRGEEQSLHEMYRFYCLYHNSGPARRNEGSLAAPYIRGVGLAFSAAYCDILRARYAAGDYGDTIAQLFMQLYETGHEEEARKWANKGIQSYDSHMCYLAATLYAAELDVDEDDAIDYLKRGSVGASEYSQVCKETLKGMRSAQIQAMRREQQAERAQQARLEEARQKAIDARMDALRSRMDLIERDIDLALTGSGHTVEERMLKGDISAMDAVRHQILRDIVEEQARKKF